MSSSGIRETVWHLLTADQQSGLLRLHTGDAVPAELQDAVRRMDGLGHLMGATEAVPSGERITPGLGGFLDEKRAALT